MQGGKNARVKRRTSACRLLRMVRYDLGQFREISCTDSQEGTVFSHAHAPVSGTPSSLSAAAPCRVFRCGTPRIPRFDHSMLHSMRQVCLRDGKQTLALLTAAQQHWTYTQVFQNPLADLAGTTAGQTELHKEVAGLGTTLADGHNILLLAAGASRSGKTFTLVGEPDETTRPTAESTASGSCLFFLAEVPSEDGGGTSGMAPVAAEARKVPKKGKGKGGGGGTGGGAESLHDGGGGGVAAKATPLAGIFPRLLAEAFATLNHRVAQCAFVVWVSAAAVSMSGPPDAASSRGTTVESLLPPSDPPPRAGGGGQVEDEAGAVPKGQKQKEERDPGLPPRAPPEDDGRWGGAVAASSPQEVMEIVTNARSRARLSEGAAGELRENRHFLFRVRVELVNRSSNEVSSCEMVVVELAEEKTGEAWPAGLAEAVRAHAAAASANSNKLDEATGLLGMVGACLTDTAKVILRCVLHAWEPAKFRNECRRRASCFRIGLSVSSSCSGHHVTENGATTTVLSAGTPLENSQRDDLFHAKISLRTAPARLTQSLRTPAPVTTGTTAVTTQYRLSLYCVSVRLTTTQTRPSESWLSERRARTRAKMARLNSGECRAFVRRVMATRLDPGGNAKQPHWKRALAARTYCSVLTYSLRYKHLATPRPRPPT